MPRYFFHVEDGASFADDVGTELPGLAEARAQAIQTAGAMMTMLHAARWHGREWRLRVVDASGNTALRLRFSAEGIDAIGNRLAPPAEPTSRPACSPEEMRAITALRAIIDDDVRETIVGLLESIAQDGNMPMHLRLV